MSKENTHRGGGEAHHGSCESRTVNNTALKGGNSNLRGANSTVNVMKYKTKSSDVRIKEQTMPSNRGGDRS